MTTRTNSHCRVAAANLREFVHDVLLSVGVSEPNAELVSEGLVRANLRGVDSHGVARLQAYVEKFRAGGFNPDPDMSVDYLGSGSFAVDADDGPGQGAGTLAMETALELAADTGFAGGVVTNSNHFGTAAFYTERASSEDCIGIAMTNVGPDVVPYQGRRRYLGTNPISFSAPTNRAFPFTLDMATSVVAMGQIDHVAKEEDASIPDDWAVDADGNPTTDPHEVAALRPMAGPKGYGMALMVDVLCGLLSGAGPSPTVGPLYDDYEEPMDLGHFVAAIDISTFRDVAAFKDQFDRVIDDIKRMESRDGGEILLPGELEHRTRIEREDGGIPLPEGVRGSLATLGAETDVPLPRALSE